MASLGAESFGRKVFGVGLSYGLAGLLRLALPIVLARLLGPREFGLFSILTVVCLMIFSLGNLGLPNAITFHFARRTRPPAVLTSNSLLQATVVGFMALVVGAVALSFFHASVLGADGGIAAAWALVAVPPYFVYHAALGVVLGRRDFRRYNSLNIGLHLLVFVAAVGSQLFERSATGAVAGWAVGSMAAALLAWVAVWPLWRGRVDFDPALWRRMATYGVKSHAAGVVTFLNYRIDLLLVAFFLGAREAGLYAAAVALGESVWFFSQVTGAVLFPEVAVENQGSRRNSLTALTSRLVLLSSGVTALVLAVFAEPLLGLVFSPPFAVARDALRLVLVGVVALSVSRVLAQFVAGSGHPERNIPGSLLGLAVNLALNLALIPWLGITGAAIATAVSYSATLAQRLVSFGRLAPEVRPLADALVPRPGDLQEVWRSLRRR